jgi:hypothetical protein
MIVVSLFSDMSEDYCDDEMITIKQDETISHIEDDSTDIRQMQTL